MRYGTPLAVEGGLVLEVTAKQNRLCRNVNGTRAQPARRSRSVYGAPWPGGAPALRARRPFSYVCESREFSRGGDYSAEKYVLA